MPTRRRGDLRKGERRRAGAADAERRARAAAVVVQRHLGGGRHHGEIAVAAADLGEGRAGALSLHTGQRISSRHSSGRTAVDQRAGEEWPAGSVRVTRSERSTIVAPEHLRHERQLCRRIGVREAAADRAAVARLHVADPGERLRSSGTLVASTVVALDHALPRAGADARGVGLDGDELERRRSR